MLNKHRFQFRVVDFERTDKWDVEHRDAEPSGDMAGTSVAAGRSGNHEDLVARTKQCREDDRHAIDARDRPDIDEFAFRKRLQKRVKNLSLDGPELAPSGEAPLAEQAHVVQKVAGICVEPEGQLSQRRQAIFTRRQIERATSAMLMCPQAIK
jgi:hypothetical protein